MKAQSNVLCDHSYLLSFSIGFGLSASKSPLTTPRRLESAFAVAAASVCLFVRLVW